MINRLKPTSQSRVSAERETSEFSFSSTCRFPSQLQESQAPSLGGEDPLETEMAIHSSFLPWEISWTEEPGRLQSVGLQRLRHNWATELTYTRLTATSAQVHLEGGSDPCRLQYNSAFQIQSSLQSRQRSSWFPARRMQEGCQLWRMRR